ncbi:MAG: TRAP transporter large permease subunit, partial [Proteobacteria bacterium]|nr:TRAP transporter large permease subunit [Pseudomonadota bacterium]
LGFFLDFIEIIFVVVPIVGPILIGMGLDPIWLGVMIAVNLQTSFLTPPFGFALFYLRAVAPASVRTVDIYRGVAPFVAIQIAALGVLAAFPALVTWLPEVLFGR